MTQVREYGFEWEIDGDPAKGQLGLLREDHYRPLFAIPQRYQSFQSTDRWLDIGANIGAFAIRAASLVEIVVAVEPEPENIKLLKHNMFLNTSVNVVVDPSAVVGDDRTSVPLSISKTFTSTHRVGNIRGRDKIQVPAIHINTLVQKARANKIKMDCEGTEAEILEAIDLAPIKEIVFEYHFAFLHDTDWSRFYRILDKLRMAGFVIKKSPSVKSKTWHTIVWASRE